MRVLALAVLLAACGSDDDDGNAPLDATKATDLCRRACERDIGCGVESETQAVCEMTCVATLGSLRGDPVTELFECNIGLVCAQSDDVCFDSGVGLPPPAAHVAFESQCTARQTACAVVNPNQDCDVDSATSDNALLLRLLTEEAIAELQNCFLDSVACAEVDPCVDRFLERHNLD